MKTFNQLRVLALLICLIACNSDDSSTVEPRPESSGLYFPPVNSDTWERTNLVSLNWNEGQLEPLLEFLDEHNSKSFIILYKGKIVVEAYFNDHDTSKIWYWASAGKALTATLTGIAQEEGFLDIDNPVSDYLETEWTSAPIEKENSITNRHLLSMTSGLDDGLGDDVSPSNLVYKADAGVRWAYHNVYLKLQDVIASSTGRSYTNYFNEKLNNPIGMKGTYLASGDFNVYWSDTRSMARFGLLISAEGKWQDQQIIPTDYLLDATTTSQNINQAYGYLWWLNGKSSFHLPQSQIEFPGKLIPTAPNDLYAALGKSDQKIYVVPSRDLVVVRMGEAADAENFALSSFDADLWNKIMALVD